MSALEDWRAKWRLPAELLAEALQISPVLLERIEAGDVEPCLDTATRLHVLTSGAVPVASWPTLNPRQRSMVTAVTMKDDGRRWGVGLIVGSAPIAWLSVDQAATLRADLGEAIAVANGERMPA